MLKTVTPNEQLTSKDCFFREIDKHPFFTDKEQLLKSQEIFDISEDMMAIAMTVAQSTQYLLERINACNYAKPLWDTVIRNKKGANYSDTVALEEIKQLGQQIERQESNEGKANLVNQYYIMPHTKYIMIDKFKEVAAKINKVDDIVQRLLNKVSLDERVKIEKKWKKNRCSKAWISQLSELSGFNISSVSEKYNEIAEQANCSLEAILQKSKSLALKEKELTKESNILTAANLKLVVAESNALNVNPDQKMDLIQEGNIALMNATKQFNPYIGILFSTYAVIKIKRAFQMYFLDNESMIHVPHVNIHKIKKIEQLNKNRSSSNQLSFQQISDKTGIPKEKIAELMNSKTSFIGIAGCGTSEFSDDNEQAVSNPAAVTNHENMIYGNSSSEDLTQEEMHEIYKKSRHVLTDQERTIMELRLGVGMKVTPAFREFHKYSEVNLVAERIRQIQQKAVVKLKDEVAKHV